jgi:predicted GIY-YIG superfamily endonuclease
MVTYLAINLVNKKFQVGSAKNFKRRQKQHLNGKGDLEFQRSLRKRPENFYWISSVDDGLETRDEEQYYLDFYCGSVWCYNHNPSASAPPSNEGLKRPEHSEFMKKRMAENHPRKGKTNTPEHISAVADKLRGRKRPRQSELLRGRKRPLHSDLIKSLKWFVNRKGESLRCAESPGPEWQPGRKWREQ